MRQSLEQHVEAAGFDVSAYDNYAEVRQALQSQSGQFGHDSGFFLLGWPAVADDASARLLDTLCRPDHHDLPVLVLAQEMRPDSRAWVAARAESGMSTRLLRWRDYAASTDLMNTETAIVPAPITDDPTDLTVSEGGVSLLLVDESPAIRQSLSDLLEQQGFAVTAVATAQESLALLTTQTFDLVLLDYYIGSQTADELCEQILHSAAAKQTETGAGQSQHTTLSLPIVAILSSQWSDVIIRKSLVAGATECLYKSEPSDLLMARIQALAALVARFRSVMAAATAERPAVPETPVTAPLSDDALVLQRHAFRTKLESLIRAHRGQTDEEPASLLLVDIGFTSSDGNFHPIHESAEAVRQMATALTQVYRREHHVSWMGNSRFGIILRQSSDSQSYLLTRKLMQIVNDIGNRTKLGEFSSNGALLSVVTTGPESATETAPQPEPTAASQASPETGLETAESMLQKMGQALNLVETRGRNNALLMDVKRLLPVYQSNEPVTHDVKLARS